MPVILRVLGLNLLAQLGYRLPSRTARTLTSLVLIAANLLPILGVANGSLGVGDVFVMYWIENVAVWLVTIVKISTAEGGATEAQLDDRARMATRYGSAGFFALHYGIFTLVHGIFAFVLAFASGGFKGSALFWTVSMIALVVSHVISLGINWFGRGERRWVSPGRAMFLPYPRMLVLHGSVIVGFMLLGGWDGGPSDSIAPVVFLCGLKTVVDLAFHVVEHWIRRPDTP